MPLNTRIALFDSDCLEVASETSRRSETLPEFGIRARMQPMAEQLDRLYTFAKEHDLTMVFTQCCSAAHVSPETNPNVLMVPLDPADESWTEKVCVSRLINIEKRNHAQVPQHERPRHEAFICRHFDAFQHNPNAKRLFQILDIPEWIVFGHGFDLCVDASVKGIISAGYQVRLLTDVIASSATGYGPYGTDASKEAILEYLKKIGVMTESLDSCLRRYEQETPLQQP